MRPRILTISDSVDTYAVIAAVEDWQEARWGPECWVTTVEDAKALFLHRARTAEAQIQAVRELHCLTVDVVDGPGGPEDVEHCQECGYIGVDAEPCPTIRILDGERDE